MAIFRFLHGRQHYSSHLGDESQSWQGFRGDEMPRFAVKNGAVMVALMLTASVIFRSSSFSGFYRCCIQ
ncbi:hypothetical protein [Photobacterium damselae]|uniref:hypothetical protein n=1 Tax=Photobacterium damselae TaxID=38293 RepID=UPI0010FEA950|nr:hypothetical protein [Photobacterium damselae]TLS65098.1 hypothetical protein FD718_21350 [Photobacterium damselae subsp. damselae]